MISKKKVFENFKLYAVTDIRSEDPDILEKIEQACRGGADILQLRSKTLADAAMIRIGRRMREIADQYGKLFFINDRVDLALLLGADGVHLGQEDMPLEEARKLCRARGQSLYLGKSTHSLEQAREAVREGADYIGVGPVFKTPTKPHYGPVGLELVKRVAAEVTIPFVAIGGIDETNLEQVLEAGATRVAVVRAIFERKDACEAAKNLRQQIEKAEARVLRHS